MEGIKENGYVRWKGFLVTMGAVLFAMSGVLWTTFLYMDSKMLSEAQFLQFEKGLDKRLESIEKSISDIRLKN